MAEVSEFSVEKLSGGGTSFWAVFAAPERQLLRPRPAKGNVQIVSVRGIIILFYQTL